MPYQDMRGNWSQANQRRPQMFKDQHGRKYFASIEIKTGEPCGLIEAQYASPLPVPLMYLNRSKDMERPYDLIVDYDRWIADVRAERTDWEKRGRSLAVRRYGPEYDPNKPLPADILEALGQAPQPVEPVLAARQGNSWILGNTKTPDPRLVKYFDPVALDPDYLRKHEPDFSDDGPTTEQQEVIEAEQTREWERTRKAAYRAKKATVTATSDSAG